MKWRALVLFASVGFVACGKTEVLPPVSQAPVAACLTLVVSDEGPPGNVYDRDVKKAVRASFEEAMVSAGFNVLGDPALPHDLLLHLAVTPGSRVESGARVRVKLTLENHGKVIDQMETTAPQEAPGYDGAVASDLVDALFRSTAIAAFTRGMRTASSKDHLAAAALRIALAPTACPSAPAAPVAAAPVAAAQAKRPASEMLVGTPQSAAYAFIVGVEDYANAPRAVGARADAERFATLCRTTLGVPEANLKLVLGEKADRLAFDITTEWLKLNVPRGGRVYFFFSGVGAFHRPLSTEFLLPHDGNPKALDKTAVSLPALLEGLGQTRARDVLAIVDAGYSGAGGRSVLASEKPAQSIKPPTLPPRVALLSAVTSAEGAGSVNEGEGLLTHYVIEGIGRGLADFNGDGQITLHELTSWAGPRLTRRAMLDKRLQTPSVLMGPGMGSPTLFVLVTGLPAQ